VPLRTVTITLVAVYVVLHVAALIDASRQDREGWFFAIFFLGPLTIWPWLLYARKRRATAAHAE
jgi:hypothetical protein